MNATLVERRGQPIAAALISWPQFIQLNSSLIKNNLNAYFRMKWTNSFPIKLEQSLTVGPRYFKLPRK